MKSRAHWCWRRCCCGIKEWRHLDWFRHNSEERQYPVTFKPGAVSEGMANTIKLPYKNKETGQTTYEPAHELLHEVERHST